LNKIAGIKHIFFDLDRTLWDFEKNSSTILLQLIEAYGLETKCGVEAPVIIDTYKKINKELWQQYSKNQITKEQLRSSRFTKTLATFDYHFLGFGLELEKEYIERSPYQTNVIEGSFEILEYLQSKYELHILTNGFKEIQHIKLKHSNLRKYFANIIISEEVGFQKPDKKIFEHAQEKINATAKECLMIGDDHNGDVQGALDAGWHAIHFNPSGVSVGNHIQIKSLSELRNFI
jgi:putative hydrolase of the HAD superfamily